MKIKDIPMDKVLMVCSVALFMCVTEEPKEATDYFSSGYAYYTLGRYRMALRNINKSIECNPNYIEAYIVRARVLMKLKNYEGAVEDSQKAIELDDNNSQGYLNLGLAYDALGKKSEARKCLTIAAELGDKFARQYLSELRRRK